MGLREGEVPNTFVTTSALSDIAKLSGFNVVRARPAAFFPFRLLGLGDLLNRFLAGVPLLRTASLTWVIVLRPVVHEERTPSLTIVIPARNEKGNIENALKRMPPFPTANFEVIFVEGHSIDGTWEEIQRVVEKYKDRFQLQAFDQTGKGKVDAVRLGFARSGKELLTILDADLTMPPELLERFYDAYRFGHADFINGTRLVYPMEGQSMRFFNHLGNIFLPRR